MAQISDPIKIGKVELKNRMAVAPTLTNFSTPDGYATPKLVDYHDRLAQGAGAGLRWGCMS